MVDIVTAAIGAKMASAQVQNMVETALSSVYKYKGQCTNAQLASKSKTAGDVWEISDDGTYAAGTDVVCDGTAWSAMSGQLHVQVVDSLSSTSATSALSAAMGKALADGKQDKLTAGSNISISEQNVISATSGSEDWIPCTLNDIPTYKDEYNFVIVYDNNNYQPNFVAYAKDVKGIEFTTSDISVRSSSYSNRTYFAFDTRGASRKLSYFELSNSARNILVNAYAFDGTPIDDTNISTYIDEVNKQFLHPIFVYWGSTTKILSGTYTDNTSLYFLDCDSRYVIKTYPITIADIINMIKGTSKQISSGEVSVYAETLTDNKLKYYRVKKTNNITT